MVIVLGFFFINLLMANIRIQTRCDRRTPTHCTLHFMDHKQIIASSALSPMELDFVVIVNCGTYKYKEIVDA